ncbi:TPA: hypothetical protein NKP98_002673 [Vibrio parahaemolyticus]|uniref:DUF6387 family protein n=3 Tax=Vibrio parahaemolyticus TaxID=670 RepID=UPI00280A367A|nr:DUF6387 family protein [Vibrio parahaemolyticus]ELA9323948.1 hypothetical protein [Vibrio parahaemolyticus]ELB2242962.1 hypothetical protein [Vibrio parahaemolyticus]MEA5229749.1 DUF6387 family protein [Vibrio parahaemolyticus]HCE2147315.1 hypothetical protein [Vibrio parahaemolyticus]HCH1182110.1 hypothetical protein [Vibrio parahaemolyticus]
MKKPKRIVSIDELPDWFSIENYNDFRSLSLTEYVRQILHRVRLFHAITDGDEPFFPASPAWDSISSGNPIITSPLESSFYSEKELVSGQLNVRDLSVADAYMVVGSYEASQDVDTLENSASPYFNHATDFNAALIAVEDLSVPTEILLIQTQKYIEELKLEKAKQHKLRKPSLRSMFQKRCHIYLDLLIWEQEEQLMLGYVENVQISRKVLLEAIFPELGVQEDKLFDRTTKELTQNLLYDPNSHLEKLQAYLIANPALGQEIVSSRS